MESKPDLVRLIEQVGPLTPEQTTKIQSIDWPGILGSNPNMYYEFICLLFAPYNTSSPPLDERLIFIEGVRDNRLSMIRDHPLLTRAKEVFKERQRIMTSDVEGATTDLFVCPSCGAREATYIRAVSTRSGDEAQASQMRCKCNFTWYSR